MGKVFFSVTMSLDGCIAPEHMQLGQPTEKWLPQWTELQKYVFQQQFFRENLKLGGHEGETGESNRILEETFARTGASIMGKRMFDGGEHSWPEEAPFHTDVFVLTHQVREPWLRPGGTTFHFVNDGIERALERARAAAGDRDIRIAGGAEVIQQYLNAGLVDEFDIGLSPMFLGNGTKLFDGIDASKLGLEIVDTTPTALVTHLRYAVSRRDADASQQTVDPSARGLRWKAVTQAR
jgi:dihydrofolate reductase